MDENYNVMIRIWFSQLTTPIKEDETLLEQKIKELVEQQIILLSNKSKTEILPEKLIEYSNSIARLASILKD